MNGSGQVARGYIWEPNGPICDIVGGQCRFYLFDGIGNTRALVSSTGLLLGESFYTAYGRVLGSYGQTTPLGWQGQSGAYFDSATGLVKLGFRYYSPQIGRFISRDSIGFAGGVNLYGYCSGDPVNACDAGGLDEANALQGASGRRRAGESADGAPCPLSCRRSLRQRGHESDRAAS